MASSGYNGGDSARGASHVHKPHWHAATARGPVIDTPDCPGALSLYLPTAADDVTDDQGPSARLRAVLAMAGDPAKGAAQPAAGLAGTEAGLDTPAELTAAIRAALADHDAIMSAGFGFSDVARHATRDDFLALLDHDDDDPPGDPHLAALQAELDNCSFTRWRCRLTWLAEVPADERTLIDELERLIVEPAVTWRELELAWAEAGAVALAASATASSAPAIICLDGRTGERIEPEQVGEQNWAADGDAGTDAKGRLSLSLFGIPSGYTRYRLAIFGGRELQRLSDEGGDPASEAMLPPVDVLADRAPELLEQLIPASGLPRVALPWFSGRLTPYGDRLALNWTSPLVGPARLGARDLILACVY